MAEPTDHPDRIARPRILIVRPSALGDVSRTVPALATLRKSYPDAHIAWLVVDTFADVIRHHPMLDAVVPFPRRELSRFGVSVRATRAGLALAKRLRREQYDLVYDLQGLFRSGLLTRLTHAPRRVGYANAREFGWLGCNVRYRIDAPHTVDQMLGLLAADGHTPVPDMRLYLGDADQHWLTTFVQQHQLDAGYACLAPTARWDCKCWPIEHYAQLARRLLESRVAGDHVVLLTSPSEQPRIQPLLDALSDGERSRVLVPTTTIGRMMALLSKTRLLVANDSAPLHIAVGFDRPLVAIFGPTDPDAVGPFGRRDAVVQPPCCDDPAAAPARNGKRYRRHFKDNSFIAQVSVESVWEKIEALRAV